MQKISSLEEFKNFSKKILNSSYNPNPCLVISAGTCGLASGADEIIKIVKRHILERKLQKRILLRVTGCQGFCEMEPFILVEPENNFYPKINIGDVPRIIDGVIEGKVLEDLLYKESRTEKCFHSRNNITFFRKQTRTILGQNEQIDPIKIKDYIRHNGYAALEKVLNSPDSNSIIQEIKKSGIRGRGGAGFPTGEKWELARNSGNGSMDKYIVCNADEGDPGAYMDRSLLEGNPHLIIEGMIIAGIATGANKGIIYVRTEYPLAIRHTRIAIRQAVNLGILGKNLLGTEFDFDIEIVCGAGAFVCGEETALIKSIEGLMGEPRQRPPYPVEKGIWGNPTCINNVETLANIPVIINKGAEEYSKIGVPGNTGTKIFSLVGKIKNTGLVEVPMGTTIGEIVYDIGGGPSGKSKIKAVQTGGPSGGCIPVKMFNLPIDYDSLTQAGSIMGSGGMIVMDENTCMVDIAKYYMNFLKDESCGKCFPCRKGTQRMYEILDDISKGKGTLTDLDVLEELALTVKDVTMCGLGQTAPNPVLSTLRYFRDEYTEHIKNKNCPAGVCKELTGVPCQSTCPLGTEVWRYMAHIQRGEYEDAYRVIRAVNPFPSVCARVCNHPCEDRCSMGVTEKQPISIRALKRFITDNVDPSVYKYQGNGKLTGEIPEIAVIGSGPAGLTAAHYLSLTGYRVTVFEKENRPGGMLVSAIPAFRLPRDIFKNEIDLLLTENIEFKYNTVLGRDITIDQLFENGFKSVFLAMGAHKSQLLNIENENADSVYPAMQFLKSYNLHRKELAKGRVGVIGGGNSAIDAARVALRQVNVEKVTVFYRRTQNEMPAFPEEIEAALEEGIKIETLVSPVKINIENGSLSEVEFIRNKLGEIDSSGRRKPAPIKGTEYKLPLDTLIAGISEKPDLPNNSLNGIEISRWGTINVNPDTLATGRPGVFAGGDVVTGPNTVVDAVAAGKKTAVMIDLYLQGKEMKEPVKTKLPKVYIEPLQIDTEEISQLKRVKPCYVSIESRKKNFIEIEKTLPADKAEQEAKRCLRCDLEFTKPKEEENIQYQKLEEAAA